MASGPAAGSRCPATQPLGTSHLRAATPLITQSHKGTSSHSLVSENPAPALWKTEAAKGGGEGFPGQLPSSPTAPAGKGEAQEPGVHGPAPNGPGFCTAIPPPKTCK